MIERSVSFPFLQVACERNISYGRVLNMVVEMQQNYDLQSMSIEVLREINERHRFYFGDTMLVYVTTLHEMARRKEDSV
jgi:hypothetical protein